MSALPSRPSGLMPIEHLLQAFLIAVIAFLGLGMALAWGWRSLGRTAGRVLGSI